MERYLTAASVMACALVMVALVGRDELLKAQ
jgi:hypothetical protein